MRSAANPVFFFSFSFFFVVLFFCLQVDVERHAHKWQIYLVQENGEMKKKLLHFVFQILRGMRQFCRAAWYLFGTKEFFWRGIGVWLVSYLKLSVSSLGGCEVKVDRLWLLVLILRWKKLWQVPCLFILSVHCNSFPYFKREEPQTVSKATQVECVKNCDVLF